MKKIAPILAGLLFLAAAKSANALNLTGFSWITNADNTIAITAYTGSATTVGIPSAIYNMTVTTIESDAFQNEEDMLQVTIPDTITTIQDDAFYNCGSLENVTIPSSVTNLGVGVFQDCFHVTVFTVDSGNPNYTSQNGVLYNKSMTTLIEYPESLFAPTTYIIPNGVTNVEAVAFWGCSYLTMLTCPASLASIGDTAFVGCTALTNITFMGNAPKAGQDLLEGDTSATVYYYTGATGWGATYAGVHAVKLTTTLPSGSLEVTLTPAGSLAAGAKWEVDNGAKESSGATVKGLSVGSHIVSFVAIANWAAPAPQTVTIANGLTNKITGVYSYDGKGNPMLTITSPKPSQVSSNDMLEVAGTATDSAVLDGVQLNGVQLKIDSSGWFPAQQTSGSWSNWNYAYYPMFAGTHTISAYATDTTGAVSHTNSVSFKYIPSATLTVHTNGLGSITPVANGRLLAISSNYTLTAMPKPNWIFSNWVASGGANYISNNPVLRFQMEPGLELTANFVTNVFLAARGTYNGLFAPDIGRQQNDSGAVTLTVTSTGMVSGKLTIGTNTTSLSGQFDPAGAVTIIAPRKGESTLTNFWQLHFANESVYGNVTDGTFNSILWADKEVFSAAHPASNYEGYYTMTVGGSGVPDVGPYGASYGTVTVSPAGAVTFKGSLADGTSVNQNSFISKDGHWPMYLPLYNGNGSLWSSNVFNGNASFSSATGSWINETNTSKTPAAYRSGFTNQEIEILGLPYESTNSLPANVTISFSGGNLPAELSIPLDVAASDTIKLANSAQATNKLNMTINKTTGVITGSFANPGDSAQTLPFGGVILRSGPVSGVTFGGYFLNSNVSGAFHYAPP